MKKKVLFPTWLKSALIGVVIVPILGFSWHNIQGIWAAPEKVEAVEKKVKDNGSTQEQLSKLLLEQEARMDKNEAVYQANLESTKEQLTLIAELKNKK